MNMLQTPTGNRDIASAQKKKGIKSSLGRFFSKKEKVKATQLQPNIENPLNLNVYPAGEGSQRLDARWF